MIRLFLLNERQMVRISPYFPADFSLFSKVLRCPAGRQWYCVCDRQRITVEGRSKIVWPA